MSSLNKSNPIQSSASRICLTKDHVIESGVCIYLSPQVPHTRVFHDKINGNQWGHSHMEAPSLRMMLWTLLSCCSLQIMVKAFHTSGWSNVMIGATSYHAACLHMDESLCCQDIQGLSQWQLGNTLMSGLYDHPGERFYHSGLRWLRACQM